jgi:dTDP-4-dehydrorhamnose reductase
MQKALVLGGKTGLLGQALTQVLRANNWQTSTLGRQDGNLLDGKFLQQAIMHHAPDVIFNTIAWTQVDAAEDNAEDALLWNRTLPATLAQILKPLDTGHLVHYSTDFVFSGEGKRLWNEEDEPAPGSVYGQTKLEGEQSVLKLLPERSCILRTAWLFGPGRKNFVQTILNACCKNKELKVVHDQVGSPTYTMDLAEWSMALAQHRASGIWHAVNSGQASWCELASEAVSLSGSQCRVIPINSAQWPQKAQRPACSVLSTQKLAAFLGKAPRPWPQALREYLFSADLHSVTEKNMEQ